MHNVAQRTPNTEAIPSPFTHATVHMNVYCICIWKLCIMFLNPHMTKGAQKNSSVHNYIYI